LSLAVVCLLAALSIAHEDHDHDAVEKISETEQHQPTVLPDRVILTWSSNPAHSVDVTWRTSTEVKQGVVQYAVATGGPYFVDNSVTILAETNRFESDLGTCHLHTVRLGALAPSTKYVYRVGHGENWSEWFHHRTASNQAEPFSFIYFGDAQNDLRSMWSRVIREAHADAPRAALLLHAGDLVNRAHRDAEWGEWFGGGGWVNAMIPSIATPGNHEYHKVPDGNGDEVRTLSKHWRPTFAFPTNGPETLLESVYYLDYQGVRFISLNSNEQLEVQVPWLEKTLSDNPNNWTIITFHHPMFSSAKGRDNATQRKIWKPLFDKYNVDLVLQGHDHSYARSGLQLPVNLETGLNLKAGPTVYVVSVSGPKQYDVDQRPFFDRTGEGIQLYQIIHVEADELQYEARTANGELYDAFTLIKRPGKSNELINEIPSTLESRKP